MTRLERVWLAGFVVATGLLGVTFHSFGWLRI